jgi:uncharacterized phage protein gp47/JayE
VTTYPLPTLAPTISASGIYAPPLSDILASLQASMRAIYGSDIYIEPDSQDGQFIGMLAQIVNENNQACVAAYNSFSPSTAQGAGLSSNVKINGLRRQQATHSTVPVLLVGQVGTIITNGIIADQNQTHRWALPASVTIPISGEITVTATCEDEGAIVALENTLTLIVTPTRGWQTVNNPTAASLGDPVETDAELRERQSVSTGLPAESVMASIVGTVANVAGVSRYRGYENDSNVTDGDGIPAHSISLVVEGGDATAIANAIAIKKTPGTGTYGTTSIITYDEYGIPNTINFYVLDVVDIYVSISITALAGYVSTTEAAIKQAIVDWLNSLEIGEDVYYSKLFGPAGLNNSLLGQTYNVTALTVGTAPSPVGTSDIAIAFNQAAGAVLANVSITVS